MLTFYYILPQVLLLEGNSQSNSEIGNSKIRQLKNVNSIIYTQGAYTYICCILWYNYISCYKRTSLKLLCNKEMETVARLRILIFLHF